MSQQPKNTLGTNLRLLRLRKRYSLRKLAREARVPKSTIWDIEHDIARDPGIFTVLAICKALGVSIITALTADLRPREDGAVVEYVTHHFGEVIDE